MAKDKRYNKNVNKYAGLFPNELKYLIRDMPRDDIDWSLVIYLLVHTNKNNFITLTKISSFFGYNKNVVKKRLNRMVWLVTAYTNYGYLKLFTTYEINKFATDALVKLIELFDIDKKEAR